LRKQILGANPITTVATYTIDAAKNTTVNLPPLPEQHRIVVVLETWDKAIELLTKKITLKKQVKKGLMQKLLTGEVRLPGFRGEWKKTELGELLNYEQPIKYLVSSTNYSNEYAVPVLTAGKTFILGYTDEKNGIYNKLPVIIFDDFTTANKYVTFPFKAKSSAMKLLTPKNEKVNLKFVFERIQIIDFPVGEHKRQYLSEYQFIPIKTPSIEEQNAIALFSEKADKELSLLNQKLSEIQKQKKFLLNNLITGAIRTPENMDTYSK
ncbi:MAG: restriction endonuclease subunit S, partial [Bacteroidota bacterium]